MHNRRGSPGLRVRGAPDVVLTLGRPAGQSAAHAVKERHSVRARSDPVLAPLPPRHVAGTAPGDNGGGGVEEGVAFRAWQVAVGVVLRGSSDWAQFVQEHRGLRLPRPTPAETQVGAGPHHWSTATST